MHECRLLLQLPIKLHPCTKMPSRLQLIRFLLNYIFPNFHALTLAFFINSYYNYRKPVVGCCRASSHNGSMSSVKSI